ncbi:MAG: N5,N10-methylene tetrahydromethanopterin reductase, partial [Thermomicrobiales bacterium]
HIYFAPTEDEASANDFDQWRTTILPPIAAESIRTPGKLEAAAKYVRAEDMHGPVRISSDIERHLEWIHQDLELGFERVYLHNVGRNQQEFIQVFGERVLPAIR